MLRRSRARLVRLGSRDGCSGHTPRALLVGAEVADRASSLDTNQMMKQRCRDGSLTRQCTHCAFDGWVSVLVSVEVETHEGGRTDASDLADLALVTASSDLGLIHGGSVPS